MVRMIRPDGGECRVHESRVEEYRKLGHLVAEETGRDAPLSVGGAGIAPSGGASAMPPHPSAAPTPSPQGEGRGAANRKAGKRKEAARHE